MRNLNLAFLALTGVGLLCTAPDAAACGDYAELAKAEASATRDVDLVICLDTSGSMKGLIDAAREKIWAIVNDLALAEPTPKLRVALVTFGSNANPEEGHIIVETGLTEDLDLVSDKLFALQAGGSVELVGRVIHTSLETLAWSKDKDALKLIAVAGNESADQDQVVPFRDAARSAIAKGIMVNSIYCGNPADPVAAGWQEVAKLADGHYASIDKDNGTVSVATPFDAKLTELSASINETYIPFGERGQWACENQKRQDGNAAGLGQSASASRAQSKGGKLYNNCSWDLVDACAQKDFVLADVKDEDLPEAMRKMTLEERRAHVDSMRKKRKGIQEEIEKLGGQRREFIAAELAKRAKAGDKAFDFAIRKAIRHQAESRGFRFGG